MLEASIPSPTVSYFKLGPLTIHFYALTMLCAIVFAVSILTLRWRRWGGTFDQVLDFTLAAVPCGLVAARIYNCLTVPWDYFPPTGSPINILKVWNGGMAIFGSLMGGAVAIVFVSRCKKIPSLLLADAVAPGLLVAQAFGRLGNWFNQELYGLPTTWPIGLKLNGANAIGKFETCYTNLACPDPQTHLFQPTFLYSIILCLSGAILLTIFGNRFQKKLKTGQIFALYLMYYGAGRAVIEEIRINSSIYFLGLRINTWAAIVSVILGVILFIYLSKRGKSRKDAIEILSVATQKEKAKEDRDRKGKIKA